MADATRQQLAALLVGRTITQVVWNERPIQVSRQHSIDRGESDMAALSLVLDNGQSLYFVAPGTLDNDDVYLSLDPPQD